MDSLKHLYLRIVLTNPLRSFNIRLDALLKCPPVTGIVTCYAEPLHLRNISSVAREKSWRGHPDVSRFALQDKANRR